MRWRCCIVLNGVTHYIVLNGVTHYIVLNGVTQHTYKCYDIV